MADKLGMRYLGITYPFAMNDGGRSKSMRPKEKNDCTVRALAIAAAMDYDLAYDILDAKGRAGNRGFHLRQYLQKRGTFNGYRVTWQDFPAEKGKTRMNPVSFSKRFKTGRYIVRTGKHVHAVIDGVHQDDGPTYDERCIYGALKFEPLTARRYLAARRARRTKPKRGARRADLSPKRKEKRQRPFVGPCRDLLELWFLEFAPVTGGVYRRFYADGPEARRALRHYKRTGLLLPSGSTVEENQAVQ